MISSICLSVPTYYCKMHLYKFIVCRSISRSAPTGNVTECTQIFRNNENTDNEVFIGFVTSWEECIHLVQANCEWANIANIHESILANQSAACWCQNGNDFTPDNSSEYLNCLFGESTGTQTEGLFYAQSIFEYFIDSHHMPTINMMAFSENSCNICHGLSHSFPHLS